AAERRGAEGRGRRAGRPDRRRRAQPDAGGGAPLPGPGAATADGGLRGPLPVLFPARVRRPAGARAEPGAARGGLRLPGRDPREVTPQLVEAVGRLVDRGVPVLSQSVLMRGVNDDAPTLEALFRRLVEARVKPYYLHHPDLARGTGHFRVSIARGRALMGQLR